MTEECLEEGFEEEYKEPEKHKLNLAGTLTIHVPMRGEDVWHYHCMDQADNDYAMYLSMTNYVMKRLDVPALMKIYGIPKAVTYDMGEWFAKTALASTFCGIEISFDYERTIFATEHDIAKGRENDLIERATGMDDYDIQDIVEGLEVTATVNYVHVSYYQDWDAFTDKVAKRIKDHIYWNHLPYYTQYGYEVKAKKAWLKHCRAQAKYKEEKDARWWKERETQSNRYDFIKEHQAEYDAWLANKKD